MGVPELFCRDKPVVPYVDPVNAILFGEYKEGIEEAGFLDGPFYLRNHPNLAGVGVCQLTYGDTVHFPIEKPIGR